MMHPQMQHHPGFQHVRHGTPGASPPMPNGAMPQFQRGPSPLPPGISRPSSRTAQHPQHQGHVRRTSSNLVPPHLQQQTQGPPPQANYAYTPNPPFYTGQPAAPMQRPLQQGHQATYPPQYPPPQAQPPTHAQIAQAYMQESRRSSLPPAFPPQPPPQAIMQRHPSADHLAPPGQRRPHPSPQPQQGQQRLTPSPQPPQQEFASPPLPQPKPLPAHAKNHSIFTPIDDSRSMLAQHWGSTSNADAARSEPSVKVEGGGPRAASIDVAAMQREKQNVQNGISPRPSQARPLPKSPQPPQRAGSRASVPPKPAVPTRSNTAQSSAKRPTLKVQIPSEQSGDEGGTGGSAPDETSTAQPPQHQGPSHGVLLPPPSPSAGALLSAGAQGPPNPFARPAPPMSTNPHAMNREANHIETPISALPSRFMSNELLPSPGTFLSGWNFGGRSADDSNMLPSPLNFQTPVVSNGQGWREEDRKRQAEEEGGGSEAKKSKT